MATTGVVDVFREEFVFKNNCSFKEVLEGPQPDIKVGFPEMGDYIRYLATAEDQFVVFQREIANRIECSETVLEWLAVSEGKKFPHFSKYRRGQYDEYNSANRKSLSGRATADEEKLAAGLTNEITSSPVILKAGQTLYHGRGDTALSQDTEYPGFLSTSLCPIVAFNHSRKASRLHGYTTGNLLYVLELVRDLPAIWGQVFTDSPEQELLLQPNLDVTVKTIEEAGDYEIVTATVDLPSND